MGDGQRGDPLLTGSQFFARGRLYERPEEQFVVWIAVSRKREADESGSEAVDGEGSQIARKLLIRTSGAFVNHPCPL